MAVDYYVDADSGSDANGGTGWGDAKQHISAAIDDLITDVITDTVTIHLKSSTTNSYTDDVEIRGITCIGSDARLVIQPEVWTESNYDNANGDPFNATPGSGTFDIKGDKPVTLDLEMEIYNSQGIELRGLAFISDSNTGGVKVDGNSEVEAIYCKFEGLNVHALAFYGGRLHVENCYFMDNQYPLMAAFKSSLYFAGNNYIEDAINIGIFIVSDSMAVFSPWEDNALDYYTTEIKTTTPRLRKYAAIKAAIGSTLCVLDENMNPYAVSVGHVHVRNEHTVLKSDYYGVLLESKSLLTSSDNYTFTTLDAKGDATDMPGENQIVISDDNTSTVVK